MASRKNKHSKQIVAIEICHSELDLVVVQTDRDAPAPVVRTSTIVWRHEAPSLHSEAGVRELTAAFKTLASKEDVHASTIHVALNGDFCVTRVVAGSADRVRREMRHLEDRSALYLSLGAGEKALAANVRQIDVRHQHAWLTVTNSRTLDAITTAADQANLAIELMEPSLVALSRAVGKMEHDAESPVVIIAVDERGVELGITYQGRLLLDYRPGGRRGKEEIAGIVRDHLDRLQRYCDRHFRHAAGRIDSVFLCGDPDSVQQVQKGIEEGGRLSVKLLDPATVNPEWQFEKMDDCTKMIAALGTALAPTLPPTDRNGPNLMERKHGGLREPMLGSLVRTAWPMAAALLLGLIGFGISTYERMSSDALQATLDSYDDDLRRARLLKMQLETAEAKVAQLGVIKDSISHLAWHTLISTISRCLPDDVWLDRVSFSEEGAISVSGSSYSDDGVYEFVRWLGRAPHFGQVALEGTQAARVRSGPSTRFDVKFELAKIDDSEEGNKKND